LSGAGRSHRVGADHAPPPLELLQRLLGHGEAAEAIVTALPLGPYDGARTAQLRQGLRGYAPQAQLRRERAAAGGSGKRACAVADLDEGRAGSCRGGRREEDDEQSEDGGGARQDHRVALVSVGSLARAFIGLGSNLGDREAALGRAVEALRRLPGTEVRGVSSFRDTEPVGLRDQPRFLNGAVELETELSPLELLERLLAIERSLGRDRRGGPPGGPRTLDLDLL